MYAPMLPLFSLSPKLAQYLHGKDHGKMSAPMQVSKQISFCMLSCTRGSRTQHLRPFHPWPNPETHIQTGCSFSLMTLDQQISKSKQPQCYKFETFSGTGPIHQPMHRASHAAMRRLTNKQAARTSPMPHVHRDRSIAMHRPATLDVFSNSTSSTYVAALLPPLHHPLAAITQFQ